MLPSSEATAACHQLLVRALRHNAYPKPAVTAQMQEHESLQIANEVIYKKSFKRIQSVKYKKTINFLHFCRTQQLI